MRNLTLEKINISNKIFLKYKNYYRIFTRYSGINASAEKVFLNKLITGRVFLIIVINFKYYKRLRQTNDLV